MKPPIAPVPPPARFVRDDDSLSRLARKYDPYFQVIIVSLGAGCLLGCIGTSILYAILK